MKSDHRSMALSLTLVLAATVLGCGRKAAPATVEPAAVVTYETTGDAEREAAERERAAAEAAAAARRDAERTRAALEARVFFDYDEAAIRPDARPTLDEKARILRDSPAIRLRIEGHADERGSTEYNLALGSRRAQSVVNYLAGYGIAAARLETVSFGEEKPLVVGSNERAWGQNRRAEFLITAGAPIVTDASPR